MLITGASSGIGVGFAHAFAREGAQLILTARRVDRLEALAAELRDRFAVSVLVLPSDLSGPDGVHSLLDRLKEMDMQVDILINNAGFGYQGSFEAAEPSLYEDMMYLNMMALTTLTRALAPAMRQRGYGGVLNVASMAGVTPIPYFSVYAATKAYVLSLTEALWKEYLNTGVRMVTLCPGPVDTEFFEVSGYDPAKSAATRGIQSVREVVDTAMKALRKNQPFVPTSLLLKVLAIFQRFIPRKLSLHILASQMNP